MTRPLVVAVTDRSLCKNIESQVKKIVYARVDAIILREKDLSPDEYLFLAKRLRDICAGTGTKLFINTFTEIAMNIGIGNLQLPLDKFESDQNTMSRFDSVWVSVHSSEEAVRAEMLGADAVIYGNVFETSCKPGLEPKGLEKLEDVCHSVKIPVLGIGGIDENNSSKVMERGAKGVCLMSRLMKADDPSAVVSKIKIV